ncbi:MAG: AAA family ATPase [Coxiellaceae bacterium]|jgi:DNA polymerase-3 subunit delta'|nr:AAA family ATPase [Coxiellaceae bacterium]
MQTILPWHKSTWQHLVASRDVGRFPHAILIRGLPGVGKSVFAKNLAALFLCQKSIGKDIHCGKCHNCILLSTDNHPDLILIQSTEQDKSIKINQIREVITELNNTSHQGGMKIVIIKSAELLNIAASNALLKVLEEPTANTLIILISSYYMLLPATIRSRCQIIAINTPRYSVANEWLQQVTPNTDIKLILGLVENSPLQALSFINENTLQKRQDFFNAIHALHLRTIDLESVVIKCLNLGIDNFIVTFMYIIIDLIKLKFSVDNQIVNRDQLDKLYHYSSIISIIDLMDYRKKLYESRRHLMNKINLNQQLLIENLLINWTLKIDKHCV